MIKKPPIYTKDGPRKGAQHTGKRRAAPSPREDFGPGAKTGLANRCKIVSPAGMHLPIPRDSCISKREKEGERASSLNYRDGQNVNLLNRSI